MILDSERQRELLLVIIEKVSATGRDARLEMTALEDAVMEARVETTSVDIECLEPDRLIVQ